MPVVVIGKLQVIDIHEDHPVILRLLIIHKIELSLKILPISKQGQAV